MINADAGAHLSCNFGAIVLIHETWLREAYTLHNRHHAHQGGTNKIPSYSASQGKAHNLYSYFCTVQQGAGLECAHNSAI